MLFVLFLSSASKNSLLKSGFEPLGRIGGADFAGWIFKTKRFASDFATICYPRVRPTARAPPLRPLNQPRPQREKATDWIAALFIVTLTWQTRQTRHDKRGASYSISEGRATWLSNSLSVLGWASPASRPKVEHKSFLTGLPLRMASGTIQAENVTLALSLEPGGASVEIRQSKRQAKKKVKSMGGIIERQGRIPYLVSSLNFWSIQSPWTFYSRSCSRVAASSALEINTIENNLLSFS